MEKYFIIVFWKALEVCYKNIQWKIEMFYFKNSKWYCFDLGDAIKDQTD